MLTWNPNSRKKWDFLTSFSLSNKSTFGIAKTPEIFHAGVLAFFGAKPKTSAFPPA
jgi:hypothetical protein